MTEATPRLLAILQLDREDRVRCQADGCNHVVYQRVHVVEQGGQVQVLGSTCFQRLVGQAHAKASTPTFTSAEGRALSPEERALLLENTNALVAKLQAEHEQKRLDRSVQASLVPSRSGSINPPPAFARRVPLGRSDPLRDVDPATLQRAMANLQQQHPGIDFRLPGFQGLIYLELKKLARGD